MLKSLRVLSALVIVTMMILVLPDVSAQDSRFNRERNVGPSLQAGEKLARYFIAGLYTGSSSSLLYPPDIADHFRHALFSIYLPTGTTLKQIRIRGIDNDASYNYKVLLMSVDNNANFTTHFEVNSNGADAGWRTFFSSRSDVVISDKYAYFFVIYRHSSMDLGKLQYSNTMIVYTPAP